MKPSVLQFKLVLGLGALLAAGVALSQASGLTRTLVGKADVSVPGREAVVAKVELAPGALAFGSSLKNSFDTWPRASKSACARWFASPAVHPAVY